MGTGTIGSKLGGVVTPASIGMVVGWGLIVGLGLAVRAVFLGFTRVAGSIRPDSSSPDRSNGIGVLGGLETIGCPAGGVSIGCVERETLLGALGSIGS